FFVMLLLFTGLAAGAYPALYVSRFNPVIIFRGRQKLGGTNPLIRVLLTFQLALSMVSIIAALILTKNAEYINSLDLGYDGEQVLVIRVNGEDQYKLLQNQVQNLTGVIATGGSRHLMGRSLQNAYVEIEQTRTLVSRFDVGDNYFEALGFELVDGRMFDAQRTTDIDQAVIVNETLVNQFGWSSALGKSVTFEYQDSVEDCQVVGVVRDFYPNGVDMRLLPAVLRLAPYERYRFLSIKCDKDNAGVMATNVEDSWKRLFPDRPYTGFWQVETLADEQQTNNSI
ncbi:MAG: hypothetical protein GY869_00980, partial [Planctomycetes bacterium]|nr:hypothetical protein [Planctomycetota bacterium]